MGHRHPGPQHQGGVREIRCQYSITSRSANGAQCLFLALFCRADRAKQCRLSGVNRAKYAHCEVFAF
jgi:hypothetical protein